MFTGNNPFTIIIITEPPYNMDLLRGKRSRKDIEKTDLPESIDFLLYAGEGDNRDRFNEIVKFKLTGILPDNLNNIPNQNIKKSKIKEFIITTHNYVLTEEEISPLSKSKLCKKDEENGSLWVIPFNYEVPNILRVLHIENQAHLGREHAFNRARMYKVKWPGHNQHIRDYIKNCKCKLTRRSMNPKKPTA